MSFQDLPRGIRDIPLSDPQLRADVVDLILGLPDRAGGCVGLMLCDAADRPVVPVVLGEVPGDAAVEGLRRLLDLALPAVASDGGSVLVGRGRPGAALPTDPDRAWHQCAIEACRDHGVRLLGFYLATAVGVQALPEPLDASGWWHATG